MAGSACACRLGSGSSFGSPACCPVSSSCRVHVTFSQPLHSVRLPDRPSQHHPKQSCLHSCLSICRHPPGGTDARPLATTAISCCCTSRHTEWRNNSVKMYCGLLTEHLLRSAWHTFSCDMSSCCLDCSVCSASRGAPSMDAAPEGADGAAESAKALAAPAQTGLSQVLCGLYAAPYPADR